MRSQNRKYKFAKYSSASLSSSSGKIVGISYLLLLLLTFVTINPIMPQSADALEEDATEAATPFALTAENDSIAEIAFSATSGSGSLSPTTGANQSAQVNIQATVNVQNSGGYEIYLKGSSQNLTGQHDSANVIPGVQGEKTFADMPANTWGYYAAEGSSVPDNARYKALSIGQGDKIAENTDTKILSDTKNIILSFAAKVDGTIPTDTYQNAIVMSVVSSPLQLTISTINNMQEMTSEVCADSTLNETNQLKDIRDGKYYWVAKLADGKCWMTQNLDLDLSTNKPLTPADSDVSTNWTPAYATATTATSSTILADNTGQRSWSLGNYRIANPTAISDCGFPKSDASQCTSQFTAYTTPTTANSDTNAHYILGNHYQWNAATAGTGGTITSGQASSSICPKGWKLPESNVTTAGSFGGLINAGSIGTDVAKLTSAPYYFVRSGYVSQKINGLFASAGSEGDYWSTTPDSNGTNAYYLLFDPNVNIHPSYSATRNVGLTVRCIAR